MGCSCNLCQWMVCFLRWGGVQLLKYRGPFYVKMPLSCWLLIKLAPLLCSSPGVTMHPKRCSGLQPQASWLPPA